jgi:hypothetical protein
VDLMSLLGEENLPGDGAAAALEGTNAPLFEGMDVQKGEVVNPAAANAAPVGPPSLLD